MKVFHAAVSVLVAAASVVSVDAATSPKQLYHITLPKTALDNAIATFGGELDIWKAQPLEGTDKVRADIYVHESTIEKFKTSATTHRSLVEGDVEIVRDPVNTAALLAERAQIRAACTTTTTGWFDDLSATTSYVDSAFFDCWRQPDEVFAFLDALAAANPTLFSKIPQVTTTYEGRVVPGYKISTGGSGEKKSIYTQSLIHAREWQSGSTAYYTMATFLDGLRSGDASISAIFAEYDWYFVPILNLDGHLWSWSNDRYWRKNRRPNADMKWGPTIGVDLNRNYGPAEFFNSIGAITLSEEYPGTGVLSEPETNGSFAFLSQLPNLRGAIDLHTYGGFVFRPYSNQYREAPAPYGAKFKTLGDNVRDAIAANYTSSPGWDLYIAPGTLLDTAFMLLNNTAALTIEVEGSDFVVPEETIRPGAKRIVNGLIQFAKELETYWT